MNPPCAVAPDLAVEGDVDGIFARGTATGVLVLSLRLGLATLAPGSRKEVFSLVQEPVGWSSNPVGDGTGHGWIDALAHNDGKASVVAFSSWKIDHQRAMIKIN